MESHIEKEVAMPEMTETKAWYESKTVWGGIIAIIAAILGIFGHQIDQETQQFLTEQSVQIASALAAAFGGAIAIYGRVKARKVIK